MEKCILSAVTFATISRVLADSTDFNRISILFRVQFAETFKFLSRPLEFMVMVPQLFWVAAKVCIELFVWSGDEAKGRSEKTHYIIHDTRDILRLQMFDHIHHSNQLCLQTCQLLFLDQCISFEQPELLILGSIVLNRHFLDAFWNQILCQSVITSFALSRTCWSMSTPTRRWILGSLDSLWSK